MQQLKSFFQLDPYIIFLNHGSFGATPIPVFDRYQQWQRRLERQPVKFLGRELGDHLKTARLCLGSYLNTHHDNLVFIPNTTFGINIIARSLNLGEGDEVLTSNHEYGACDKTWRFVSEQQGFRYIKKPLAYPFVSREMMVEQLWSGVTPRTRVIFMSHISSSTAVIFPIAEICRRARQEGILTVIDGAHAPGQIELDLEEVGADCYCGNLHKWVSAPKGSAFIYTRPDLQHLIKPLVVSWGWGEPKGVSFGSNYLDTLQYTGTNDFSAYLSVPAAIDFQAKQDWTAVREACHDLLSDALDQVAAVTGLPSPYPDDTYYRQMAIAPLPKLADLAAFKEELYDQFQVEIPCLDWEGHQFIRISVQGYNTVGDIDRLLEALTILLPKHRANQS